MVTLIKQDVSVSRLESNSNTTVSYIDTKEKKVWVRPIPIRVENEELKVRPESMEIGRPYRFVWGGTEIFALRRDATDKVEFYVINLEKAEK